MSKDQTGYILAIDLGTSGPKVALYSLGGRLLDFVYEPVELLLLPNGGAEQRPEEWWEAIVKATGRLLSKGLVPIQDIVALNCTTQWSGTVAVDREGKPLMPAIIWMDTRGAPYIERITDGLFKIEGYALEKLVSWIRLTGGIPGQAGKDPIAHILYLKHEHPEIYRQTFKFMEPKDYLNLRLTGKFTATYDSITLHWVTDNRDISNIVYHDKLLERAQLDREKLPALRPTAEVLGKITPQAAEELGLTSEVKVVVGTPDLQSAAVGSGAVLDYQPHLYIGTSSWLTCHVPFKKVDIFHNIATLPSALPGKYFVANEQECAGACLTYLSDNLFFHEDELDTGSKPPNVYKVFDRIAEKAPPGSNKLIFTPWLYGERTPVDDHSVRGAFFNQSLHTTREDLIRSVFEGVAYNSKWLLGYVEKFVKRRLDPINLVGGGAQSRIWCQIYADVLNRTIRQVKDPILVNTRGAAFLASMALGELRVEDIPARVEIEETFEPKPENRQIYNDLYREFLNLYKAAGSIHKRLNKIPLRIAKGN